MQVAETAQPSGGTPHLHIFVNRRKFEEGDYKQWLEADSYAVFSAAIAMGNADLAKNKEKFADENEPDYCIMSVSAARKMGILPIGFKSNAQFAPVAK